MSSNNRMDDLYGACRVVGSSGAVVAPSGFLVGGISACVRSGAGVYAVTLAPGADQMECVATVQIEGGAGNANAQLAWTSDTSLAITTFVGAVATDEDFKLVLRKVRVAG